MLIKLLNEYAKCPTRADSGSAGYDLYCSDELVMISPGQRKLLNTGISVSFDKKYYIRIAPRSGLSVKGIDVGAGVIDSSYRGEIKVLLINNSKEDFTFLRGDRIAQAILETCHPIDFKLVEELDNSDRGSGGFGSSGQ